MNKSRMDVDNCLQIMDFEDETQGKNEAIRKHFNLI